MSAPAPHHLTAVAAPRGLGDAAGPLILDREDDDFIGAVLGELGSEAGRAKLRGTVAKPPDKEQTLKLFQPVQRRFHLALIEAWCDTAGTPRLDPSKVEAAGLVLRRVRHDAQRREFHEGWMKAGGVLRGWLAIDRLGPERDSFGALNADPQPATRLARRDTGVKPVDRALRALAADSDASLLEEQFTPLFVAPPEVCRKAGRSIWYGVVQTTSSELAQTGAEVETLFGDFGPESADFKNHLVHPLHGLEWTFPNPPQLSSHRFDAHWLDALLKNPVIEADVPVDPDQRERRTQFLQLLRQVAMEFDAFGASEKSRALLYELAQVRLSYRRVDPGVVARSIDAATFLKQAVDVLFGDQGGSVEMPETWPELSGPARRRLLDAMSAAMLERFRSVKGRPGRYDEPDARYVLRAFVRLKPDGRCAAKTVWTEASEHFVIAPWYETGGNPVQIALPKLDALKKLKPNVSFVLPKELQNLLMGNPEDLMKGKGSTGGLDIGWICSFSIPVITFCAFIVLNIFLSLFDLIFRWSLFIKVCIPYPKAK